MGSHRTRQGPTPVASKRYQRHEPEATPLNKIVAEHLESFLAEARETHEHALPQYVERELREYLKCGILAHGFFLTVNVEMRVVSWLRRHGLLDNDPDEPPTERVARSALDACLEGSLGLGELTAMPRRRGPIDDGHEALPAPPRSQRRGGHVRGFDVHAGVVVSASDREGRERLLRYCARPPLSLERLSVLRDGRIAYAIRKPWGNETHRVMSPLQFLARLAALIPPPRHPLIRFYGVFAPHSSWRQKVVPIRLPCCRPRDEEGSCSPDSNAAAAATTARAVARIVKSSTLPILANRCSGPAPSCSAAIAPRYGAQAADHEPTTRVDWEELLKRVHDVDALACSCGGRLKFIALILDENPARAILERLRLPSAPPAIARARSLDWLDPIPVDA